MLDALYLVNILFDLNNLQNLHIAEPLDFSKISHLEFYAVAQQLFALQDITFVKAFSAQHCLHYGHVLIERADQYLQIKHLEDALIYYNRALRLIEELHHVNDPNYQQAAPVLESDKLLENAAEVFFELNDTDNDMEDMDTDDMSSETSMEENKVSAPASVAPPPSQQTANQSLLVSQATTFLNPVFSTLDEALAYQQYLKFLIFITYENHNGRPLERLTSYRLNLHP